jgi:uncharacterized membrane protein SpoIIM required for sporulation
MTSYLTKQEKQIVQTVDIIDSATAILRTIQFFMFVLCVEKLIHEQRNPREKCNKRMTDIKIEDNTKDDTNEIKLFGISIYTIRVYLIIVALFTLLAILVITVIYILGILSGIGIAFTFYYERKQKQKKVLH